MWLFREVSSPYLFVLAQIDPDIKWRAHSFRLKFGGIAELREQVKLLWWLLYEYNIWIMLNSNLVNQSSSYASYFYILGSIMIRPCNVYLSNTHQNSGQIRTILLPESGLSVFTSIQSNVPKVFNDVIKSLRALTSLFLCCFFMKKMFSDIDPWSTKYCIRRSKSKWCFPCQYLKL